MIGPPEPHVATKAVGIPPAPHSTENPSASNSLASSSDA